MAKATGWKKRVIIKPLFKKNYFIFSAIILSAIFLAFILSLLIEGWQRNNALIKRNNAMATRPVPVFGKMLLKIEPDPHLLLEKIKDVIAKDKELRMTLIDAKGVDQQTQQMLLPAPLTTQQLQLLQQGESISIGTSFRGPPNLVIDKTRQANVFLLTQFMRTETGRGPRPPGDFEGSAPPEMRDDNHGEAGPPPNHGGIFGLGRPPPPREGYFRGEGPPPGAPHMLVLTICCIVGFVFVSVGISLFLQASKYRERAEEALHVLNELRQGNFLTRMPTKKFDELEPLVVAFNLMADDLESMVGRLQSADRQRRQLLQDLAHDLRTPMTSLHAFLEILKNSESKISEDKRQEVLNLCFSEINYFSKLVEDLLFLAQITEPKYSLGSEKIHLSERVSEQITVFKTRYPALSYDFVVAAEIAAVEIIGSVKLIDRLLRNAFENSSSFARQRVSIEITLDHGHISLVISDDGPGFSAEALREFGQKKTSRVVSDEKTGSRISVGIGSVIMKEITQLHSGTLKAENIIDQGFIRGSKISFSFLLV